MTSKMRVGIVDLLVCGFGGFAGLLFMRVFGDPPSTALFFLGISSLGLSVYFSLVLLSNILSVGTSHADNMLCVLRIGLNLVPAALFVLEYSAKSQLSTPPGCC